MVHFLSILSNNSQLVSNLIAIAAFFASIYAVRESRQQHIESYRAKLVFHIMQEEQKLFLTVQNIGQTVAFDIHVDFHGALENPVEHLHTLPPGIRYRYVFMELHQVANCTEQILHLSARYKDISSDLVRTETYQFEITEILKYSCRWNENQFCYDVFPI